MLSMLRVGRILLKKENVRFDIRANQISRTMQRHYRKIGQVYTAREIRELIGNYCCYFCGGGIQVEAQSIEPYTLTKRGPDYTFTFTKLFRPDPTESGGQTVNQVNEQPTNL